MQQPRTFSISCHTICTEPRDKIFGPLPLAEVGREIKVEYTRTMFEIYKDVLNFEDDEKIILRGLMDGLLQR